jgi:hypothetical protein
MRLFVLCGKYTRRSLLSVLKPICTPFFHSQSKVYFLLVNTIKARGLKVGVFQHTEIIHGDVLYVCIAYRYIEIESPMKRRSISTRLHGATSQKSHIQFNTVCGSIVRKIQTSLSMAYRGRHRIKLQWKTCELNYNT